MKNMEKSKNVFRTKSANGLRIRTNRNNNPTPNAAFGKGANYTSNNNNRVYSGGGAGWYGG